MEHEPAHVLLIEDNPGDADLVRLRLVEGKSNVQVNCVPRLSDALASLDVDTPSLVLLDLNLPDSHGAETFRRIRQKAPNVPVVILSGQDDEALAIKAVHMGVQDYLVKSDVTGKQLERALRYAVERQGLLLALEVTRKQQIEFKNFCRMCRTSCAHRSPAFTNTSRFYWTDWPDQWPPIKPTISR
jgi:DNA-binding response OmpR family regulator